jgi:excisionase family DNA binding protein
MGFASAGRTWGHVQALLRSWQLKPCRANVAILGVARQQGPKTSLAAAAGLRTLTTMSLDAMPRDPQPAVSATLVDAAEAGRLLSVPASWVLAEARADRIPHVRLGRYVRFSAPDLKDWWQARTRGPWRARGRDVRPARSPSADRHSDARVRRSAWLTAFALCNGTAPIPAPSGKTVRHCLNRGGDRQVNNAIHTIALSRSPHHPRRAPTSTAASPKERPNARPCAHTSATSPDTSPSGSRATLDFIEASPECGFAAMGDTGLEN